MSQEDGEPQGAHFKGEGDDEGGVSTGAAKVKKTKGKARTRKKIYLLSFSAFGKKEELASDFRSAAKRLTASSMSRSSLAMTNLAQAFCPPFSRSFQFVVVPCS